MQNYNYFVEISSVYFLVFMIGTFLSSAVSGILEWLNSNKGDISKKLKDTYRRFPITKEFLSLRKIKKSMEYDLENDRFSNLIETIKGGAGTILMLIGILPFTLHFLISNLGMSTYSAYISSAILATILSTIVGIPISYYYNFKIEKKYGFNKMTIGTFISDNIKTILIESIITSCLILILNYILTNFGRFDMKTAGILVAIFVLGGVIMESFSFTFMKMFNKFEPLKDKKLKKDLEKLLTKASLGKMKDTKIYVMNESKRSSHTNAFVFGSGKHKKIVLFDTLLKNFTKDEILSIIAHEIGHSKHHHIFISRILGLILTASRTFLTVYFMYNTKLYTSFGYSWITEENVLEYSLLGMMLANMLFSSVSWILSPISSYISRKMEYQADTESGILMGYLKEGKSKNKNLASALLKLTSKSLSDPFPNELYEFWFYDHPSILKRLENIGFNKKKSNNKAK